MNDLYKKTKDVFEKELEKIIDKGNVNSTDLDLVYKLVDIIKDIGEICEKDEEMYGYESSGRRGYGMMRSRYYPYMGEYTVEGSYGRGYSGEGNYRRGYSADGGYGGGRSNNSAMKAKLQQLMSEAKNDHEKMMIQSWMDDLG